MNPTTPRHQRLSLLRQHLLAAIVLGVGVAASIGVLLALRGGERERMSADFHRASADRGASLAGDMGAHNLTLSSLQAFFRSDQEVSREEFHTFTTHLLAKEPSIQALAWIPRVRRDERAAYEAAARKEYGPLFHFTERTAQGMRPRGESEEYFPVYFVEPIQHNTTAMGFDHGSDATRRRALEHARDTGEAVATEPVDMVQPSADIGYLIFLPVYEQGSKPRTVEERRARLKGFAMGVFRSLATLVDAVKGLTPMGIDLYVVDSTTPGTERPLAFLPSRLRTTPLTREQYLATPPPAGLRHVDTLELAGRTWKLLCTPTPDFVASRTTFLPWAGLATGLLITIVLTFYLFSTARHMVQIRRLADQTLTINHRLATEIQERIQVSATLVKAQEEKENDFQSRAALNELLSLSLTDLPLDELLQCFIDRLTQIRWLGIEPKGAIFLVERDADVLVMKAQQRLAAPLLDLCARVPFGRCLCGRAAQTREVVFAGHVDDRHDNRFPGISGHGHYCVPIVSADKKVLGVITLYLKEGHLQNQHEEEFLRAAANILVGITERKLAEEALRESREFLDTIMNVIRDPIFVMDDQHRYVLMNDAGLALSGRTRQDVLGKTTRDLFPPYLADAYLRKNEEVLATGADDLTEEPSIDAQGQELTLSTKKSRYVDPSGRRYVVGVLRDITQRKHLENELRESHSLLEQRVVERTRDLVKANEQIRQAQADLVQSEKMSMLGQLVAGVAHEMNTPLGAILNVMADALSHLREFLATGEPIFQLADGARQWVVQMCARMLTSPPEPSDSLRRPLRLQIEKDVVELGIPNPRRVAALIAACFGSGWREEPRLLEFLGMEPILAAMEHMHSLKTTMDITTVSAQKIARIVRALKYYSHTGQDELADINVNESLDNTLVILQNRIKHVAEVSVEFDPHLPPVRCGADISQVWTNILNNACDAIEDTHDQATGRIHILTHRQADQVIVRICDNGPAIPEAVLSQIFDPFFTTKPIGKGTGLGLSICRGIIQRCGGSIRVMNDPGALAFEVVLPVSAGTEPGRAAASAGGIQPAPVSLPKDAQIAGAST